MGDRMTDREARTLPGDTPDVSAEKVLQHISFTAAARATIKAALGRDGPQTILLGWPAGATYLPSPCYEPSVDDIEVGQVEGCPIYVDSRRLAMFPTAKVTFDAAPTTPWRLRPSLRARTLPTG
jgi:hypothetical protein